MATAIEFNHVSKQYRLGLVSTGTLRNDLHRWFVTSVLGKEDPYLKIGETNDRSTKGTSEYVWALKDIHFNVEQGDVVGIIGKNGAGKSTLLKLLSRVTAPTLGTIRAKGRIASLLEVGTGFHSEMTGRENIYLNGAILGMTKAEIDRKLDEIIDFSGCERYIDTPVKRYSSGMTVRLGFAVAAHLDPEILVVDEVLAVGDAEFQKKAIGKMQDVSKGEGRTVLFVSHNMASIRALCHSGILLENGQIQTTGPINDVVDTYLAEQFQDADKLTDIISFCAKGLKVNNFLLNNQSANALQIEPLKGETTIDVHVEGELEEDMRIDVEARLYDKNHVLLAHYSPSHMIGSCPVRKAGKLTIDRTIHLPENITCGTYYLDLSLAEPRVAYKVQLSQPIKIVTGGKLGDSGLSFDYAGNGMLILN